MNARWITVLYTVLVSIWDWIPYPFHLQVAPELDSFLVGFQDALCGQILSHCFLSVWLFFVLSFHFCWSVGLFVFGMI